MIFDFSLALDVALPLARTAYSFLPADLPDGWTIQSFIHLDQSIAVSLFAKHCPQEDPTVPFGLIAVKGDQTAFAFRGTVTQVEWSDDFDFIPVPALPLLAHCRVEEGFYTIFRACRNNRVSPLGKILITGHSLGAALAQLLAVDIANQGGNPTVITWSGPRVGDARFAKLAEALVPNCWRIVNCYDVVPDLPLELFGYRHFGTAIEGKGLGDHLHPRLAHSLDGDEAGLRLLQPKVSPKLALLSTAA